jgi:hypothetical protein
VVSKRVLDRWRRSSVRLRLGALFAERDALYVMRAASGAVAGDESGTHLWVSLCGFELSGHAGEETS